MSQFTLIIFMLLQQQLPANAAQEEAAHTLVRAAERGDVEAIRSIRSRSDISWPDKSGRTALVAAAYKGQKAAFKELISIANEDVRTAVQQLPIQGQPAVAPAVVATERRMRLFNKADAEGVTPLMLAAQHGWEDLSKALVEGGATVTGKDKDGRTAGDHAGAAGHPALAEYLRLAEKQPQDQRR